MRYFVVHKDYTTTVGSKLVVYDTIIYEVTAPKKDSSGRWKVEPKIPLKSSPSYHIDKGWIELYHDKEMVNSSGQFQYWRERYHDLTVANDGSLIINTANNKFTYNTDTKKTVDKNASEGKIIIANANDWTIGATIEGNNVGDNYCFYCEYPNDEYMLVHSSLVSNVHSASKHSGQKSTLGSSRTSDSFTNDASKNNGAIYNSSTYVEFTKQGKRGTYVDGKASTPYLMMELFSPGVKGTLNLSIPANNFVDLNHVRNLSDSYNTFSINLFDKDATQVEAKLVLGFRHITFYYTDFVSESKRFTGEILNYQTVITGKGLMLTITGYTSNVKGMIGQDSIPWKTLCDANSYGFYYWLNDNGDYFGIICRDDKGNISPVGTPVPYPDTEGGKYESYAYPGWFNTYKDKLSLEDLIKYEPRYKIWSLTDYNSNFKTIAGEIQWSAKKPSDIVRAICAINGWAIGEIEETKSVPNIPDQINESATEYIKERLIPISESRKTGKAQYYFWFDDNGAANFRTGYGYTTNPKVLYFNAGKDKPDSYPLVGFTAATNGAILMIQDATNYMDSVNVYTGDTLSSEIERDEMSLKSMGTTSDWYSTNKITTAQNAMRAKITYKATSSVPSEQQLNTMLKARYEYISNHTYQAELQVRGCTDISPGDSIKVVIYLDEDLRKAIPSGMHHTSGTYFVNKIVDTISGGKFISTLTCLKLGDLDSYGIINYDTSNDLKNKKDSESSEEGNGVLNGAQALANFVNATNYTAGGGGFSVGGGGNGAAGGGGSSFGSR